MVRTCLAQCCKLCNGCLWSFLFLSSYFSRDTFAERKLWQSSKPHYTHTSIHFITDMSYNTHTHTLLWVPCPSLPSFSMKALSTHIDLRDASDADGESGAGEVLVGQGQALSVKRAAGIQRLLHCRPHQVCHAATACQAKVCV